MIQRDAALILRCDSGADIGNGHLARCLSLAERWAYGPVHLAGTGIPPMWHERLEKIGIELHGAEDLPDLVAPRATVVVDGYHLADAAHGLDAPIVRIDDFGSTRHRGAADLIVDQSVSGHGELPTAYVGGGRVLRGPRYIMVSRSMQPPVTRAQTSPHRLAVAVGGRPSEQVLGWASDVVSSLQTPVDALWLIDVDDPADLLGSCEVALSLAGSTTWELCRLGVPAVFVARSPNQDAMLERIGSDAIGIALGRMDDVASSAAAAALDRLLADDSLRDSIRRRGMALVDGGGVRRVATAIRSGLLRVRPATMSDRDLYLEWANEPDTRAASFNRTAISPDAHEAWFRRKLAHRRSQLLVVSDDDTPIGQFRVERTDHRAVVSVSLDARARGRGLGAPLIDAGSRAAFSGDADLGVLYATIRQSNEVSQRAFEAADYDYLDHGVTDGVEWVRLARDRVQERDVTSIDDWRGQG